MTKTKNTKQLLRFSGIFALATVLLMGIPSPNLTFAAIDSTSGDANEIAPPANVGQGFSENDDEIQVFQEKQNYQLQNDVDVDNTADGSFGNGNEGVTPGTITEGTFVNSYLVHIDLVGQPGCCESFSGSITFENDIIGLIIFTDSLAASDAELGHDSTTYPGAQTNRGLDWGLSDDDDFTISGNTLTVDKFDVGAWADNVRVLTGPPVVEIAKFYDANHNGLHDEGEVFLDGWLVHVNDTNHEYEFTNATYVLPAGEIFNATEFIPDNNVWIPTNDTVVTFNSTEVDEILFSNICVGESGENPHTKGFWSNKNGQTLCEQYESAVSGNLTQYPNFVDSENNNAPIANCVDVVHNKNLKPPMKNYLKNPTHGNINYTLSQQLLTMVFNNATESINPTDEVYCHSIGEYFSLNSLMIEGNATLAGIGSYDAGDLAECLDEANNDMNYVQDEACEYDFGTTLTVSKVLTELDTIHGNNTNVPSDDGNFWWNVTISNTGNWPAVNANLTDISNSTNDHINLNGCDDAGTETLCDLGDLENGTSIQIDIAGEVEDPGDIVVNIASTIAENALEAIYVLVNTIIEEAE